MGGYIEIVPIYVFKKIIKFSLSRQGEACKDKIDASKTPRSVSQLWISANFSTNKHVVPCFSEIFTF